MKIMKFGGSSVGTGERILHVAEIIRKSSKKHDTVVVVSAMQNVTDTLIAIFQKCKERHIQEASENMEQLYQKHKAALDTFGLTNDAYESVNNTLINLFSYMKAYLTFHSNYSLADYDFAISLGERLSSHLIAAAINKIGGHAQSVCASEVIVATNFHTNGKARIEETKIQANKILLPLLSQKITPIVTGFYGATKDGSIVTLGRGGSDYSATILANTLDADEVILWKEVDGVYSADPKKDNQAIFYPKLSYAEALSLAEKGAKVLHPEAMIPVSTKNIIVWVKNTFKPDFDGTRIWKEASI